MSNFTDHDDLVIVQVVAIENGKPKVLGAIAADCLRTAEHAGTALSLVEAVRAGHIVLFGGKAAIKFAEAVLPAIQYIPNPDEQNAVVPAKLYLDLVAAAAAMYHQANHNYSRDALFASDNMLRAKGIVAVEHGKDGKAARVDGMTVN